MILPKTWIQKIEKLCIHGVKPNTLKMFQVVPCIIFELSWKFDEISRNVANSHDAAPSVQTEKQHNQL